MKKRTRRDTNEEKGKSKDKKVDTEKDEGEDTVTDDDDDDDDGEGEEEEEEEEEEDESEGEGGEAKFLLLDWAIENSENEAQREKLKASKQVAIDNIDYTMTVKDLQDLLRKNNGLVNAPKTIDNLIIDHGYKGVPGNLTSSWSSIFPNIIKSK